MSHIYDELYVNINSFGTFAAIVVLIFFIIAFIIFSLFFQKIKLIRYSILLQIMMVLYLSIFLIIVNTTDPNVTFQMTRLLYVTFMIHSVVAIFTVSHIAAENLIILKSFSIVSALLIIGLIYVNDTFIITREVIASSYYMAVKGPFFAIAIIYILLIGLIMITNYFMLYKKNPQGMKKLWPIFLGIIIFTFYTDFQGVLLYVNPHLKPQLYIPVLIFLFLFLLYIFTEVKQTLNDREKMYMAYLYDALTGVYTRNFIIEEINEAISHNDIHNHYVAMIDIDGFKIINDTYGHMLGDQVLKSFGKLLCEIDLEVNLPGRLGGDEFIIFFKNCQKDKILQSMNDLLEDYTLLLTKMNIDILRTQAGLSIGLININTSMTLKDILTLADKTMYDAKKNGKNTIRVLDSSTVSN